MTAATSKIRYANQTLEEKHQQQVRSGEQQQGGAAQPRKAEDSPATGGREFGNNHETQAENATSESGLADD